MSIAIVVISLCGTAAAQQDLERARERFEQGEAYFKAGTFDRAIEEYEAAYALVPRAGLLFNIGLCHENLGDAASAMDYYDRYIAADPGGSKVTEARARREALVRKLDEQRADADRQRRADEERAAGLRAFTAGDHAGAIARLSASYELVPNADVIFELAEAYLAKGDDILAATEYRRYLDAAQTGANRERAGQRLREIEARTAVPTPGGAAPPEAPSMVPAYVAYSIAGVALGAGIVFGLDASSTLDELDDELMNGTPPLDSRDPRLDDGRRAARNADISFAIAGVAAATGAYLTWRTLRKRKALEERDDVVVLPVVTGDGAGVGVGLTW